MKKMISCEAPKRRLINSILSRNRITATPRTIKNEGNIFGGHPISDLPQLITRNLTAKSEIKLLKAHMD